MSAIENVEYTVIGAGVIGLAIARALALQGREVIILESEPLIGTGNSSRNSEVIHAGIYYKTGSLKAKLCVAGKVSLYDYCKKNGVPFKRCGKIIVATNNGQIERLKEIKKQAIANNVTDLIWQDKKTTLTMEPELNAKASLLSPSTGLIDSHALMLSYQGEAEAHGAVIAYNTPVLNGKIIDKGILLNVGGKEPMTIKSKSVFNCSGLGAQKLAANIKGFPRKHIPETHYAKGNYFSLNDKNPFSHLIYPIPEEAGLGVHLTIDLGGQAKFGPDVEWINTIDYKVNPLRSEKFYQAIRDYWPGLRNDTLIPSYSGIRPKLQGKGNTATDFLLSGPSSHGVQGLVNLFGIESPGLTASLSIADEAIKCL